MRHSSDNPASPLHPRRLWRSFGFALAGLGWLLRHERNAQVHALATVAVVIAGALTGINAADWRWLLLAVGLVWCAEALNSALEQLADHVAPEHHRQVGLAKDLAAAGVLCAALTAAGLGLMVLLPYWLP